MKNLKQHYEMFILQMRFNARAEINSWLESEFYYPYRGREIHFGFALRNGSAALEDNQRSIDRTQLVVIDRRTWSLHCPTNSRRIPEQDRSPSTYEKEKKLIPGLT